MDFTVDGNATKTSMTSFVVVAAMHVALICALLFGLKTVSVKLPDVKDMVQVVIPTTLQPPLPPVIPPVVSRTMPVFDYPVIDTPVVITLPPQPPIIENGPKIDGPAIISDRPATPKALDIFTAAVVDARSCDKPEYPANALRNEFTGVVTLELLVGPDGRAGESKILQSSGHRDLDQAAIAGLRLCRFKPATLNGQAQKSWAKLQYAWNLDGR